jgi:hypothetical protein
MRRALLFLLCAGFFLPVLLRSETLHLKDGSVVKGRFVKTEGDTVFFETSFGTSIRVHKDKVARIDFGEGPAPAPAASAGDSSMRTTEAAGTLMVSFEDFELTSKIVMERRGDRNEYERENAIEQALFVDQRKMHSVVDSTTDKVVRSGPETTLRNKARPVEFRVPVGAGTHQCSIVFSNSRAREYAEKFDPSPLAKKLVLDGIVVKPNETTVLRIGMKRKAWRVGKSELVRIVE